MKFAIHSAVFAASLLAATAHAQVSVQNAWVRATVPQQTAAGAFMQIKATRDSRLVAATSPLTNTVQVHEMSMMDNVMKMRLVSAVDLPAGQTVELKPGGYHLMLMDLQQQVKEGDTVPLTLILEDREGKRESVEVTAPVRALTARAHPSNQGGHGTARQ